MTWLSLLLALAKLLGIFAGYLSNKQLIEAGAAEAFQNGVILLNEKVAAADAARKSVDPTKLRDDDGFRRD